MRVKERVLKRQAAKAVWGPYHLPLPNGFHYLKTLSISSLYSFIFVSRERVRAS